MSDQKKALKALIENLAEVISEDKKLNTEFLESTGIDIKELEENGENFIKDIKGKLQYQIAEKKLKRLRELKGMFVFQKEKLLESSKNKIAEILSNGNKTAYQTYYRKLEKLTEKDYREIESEQQFLDFMKELEE